MQTSIGVTAPHPLLLNPEGATNLYLTKDSLEIEDNNGFFEIIQPPPVWVNFFDTIMAEKSKLKATKSDDFTKPFLGQRWRCILANELNGHGINMRRLMSTMPRIREDLMLDWQVLQPLTVGSGLTIFAGQIGSGKSTTMVAVIDRLGRRGRGGLGTVEDPIEVPFTGGGVIQREVRTHVNSFEEAIRDFMRQNRRTIMVGEIRDPETANAAILAASSGHSVYGTLHADSVLDIYPRLATLVDAKYERIIAGTLRGLWWQHVVRHGDLDRPPAPIYESLVVTGPVRNILQGTPDKLPLLMTEMKSQGRKSMAETAMQMVNSGRLKREEVQEWITRRGRINDVEYRR